MKRFTMHAVIGLVLGLGLTLALLGLLSEPSVARPTDEFTVCPDGTCDHTTIQAAVDAAQDGDVIKVAAFTYHDVHARSRNDRITTGVVTQVVYVDKSVIIRGGYTKAFAEPPDPVAHPTTLDPQGRGRGIYITGDVSPTIEGLRITGGDATGLGGYSPIPSIDRDAGGGVYVISATVAISRCQMFSNTVAHPFVSYGGGLYGDSGSVTLIGNGVTSNTVGWNGQGAGLYLIGCRAALRDNVISDNATGPNGDGGGLYLFDGPAALSDNTFEGNHAVRSGGGLHLNSSAVTLTGNVVASNTAGTSGGGLLVGGHATLSANSIISNAADRGGGLYLNGSDITLRGNVVVSNVAAGTSWSRGGGGGLCLDQGAATLEDNTIAGNTSYYWGGGVYVYDSEGVTLTGNAIRANTAITGGGGLGVAVSENAALTGNTFIGNSSGTGGGLRLEWSQVTLTNNVVADNEASVAGGGLYVRRCSSTLDDSVRLRHTTIARNSGGGGSGVYIAYSTDWPYYSVVDLANTILVSHTVGITVASGSTATLEATLWQGNDVDHGGGAVISSTNVTGDPAFVDPDAGDYHIREESAARDEGVNVFVTSDIDGQLRPQGGGYDIGADEFHPLPSLTVVKWAESDPVEAGGQLTYTILLTNTGNVSLHAAITDVLPDHVTPAGLLTWTADIPAPGGVWMETVVVTVEKTYVGSLTNVVQVTTEQGAAGTDSVTVRAGWSIYLPLLLRSSQ